MLTKWDLASLAAMDYSPVRVSVTGFYLTHVHHATRMELGYTHEYDWSLNLWRYL